MTYEELVNTTIGFHSSILLISLAAYYKYGDRTQLFAKSLEGSNATLERIRKRIANELGDKLKPLLGSSGSVSSSILAPDGTTYWERAVSVVEGEEFRDVIQEYVEHSRESMVDCRTMVNSRNRWCVWAARLSQGVLSVVFWEVLCVMLVGLVGKLLNVNIPLRFLIGSLILSGVITVICLSLLLPLQYYHTKMLDLRRKYNVA